MMGIDIRTMSAPILSLLFSGNNNLAFIITSVCLIVPPLYYLYRYRSSIKKRLKEIESNVGLIKVVRNKNRDISKNRVTCMDLDPEFVTANPDWHMMSFGEYLSQLEPADKNSPFNQIFLQKELQIVVGELLLKKLGKTYGAALLPILGVGSVAASIAGISNKISDFIAKSILSEDKAAVDPLTFDLSLMEIISFANLNQKGSTQNNGPSHVTPLEHLSRGENAWGDLAFDLGDGTFPDIFDVDKDFQNYVFKMEKRILEKDGTYDPNDSSFPPPTPVNERLLPGLYLGKGGLKCTHTRRECIEHRLLCVLINKLTHNYYKLSRKQKPEDCFLVFCGGKKCLFPEELIQSLVDCGHQIKVCPRVLPTNFGLQFCVKEEDGSFTSIPTALFLLTGVERSSDNKPAYFAAPHGGMDVSISGPIVGKGYRPAWLQFYVSINGLCCFHPDEDQDTPWAAKTSLAEIYCHDDAIRAIRMCALVSVTFNRIATEQNLPFGGYGILGMCNDSATIIDLALRGTTSAYPLLSTGRYLNHIVSSFTKLKNELSPISCEDLTCLIKSTGNLPSDLHISPAKLINLSERYDKSYGVPVFQATAEAKSILRQMANDVKEYFS